MNKLVQTREMMAAIECYKKKIWRHSTYYKREAATVGKDTKEH